MKKLKNKKKADFIEKESKILSEKIKAKNKEYKTNEDKLTKASKLSNKIRNEIYTLEREKAVLPFRNIEIQKGDIIVKVNGDYGWHADIATFYIVINTEKGINVSSVGVHRSDERLLISGEKAKSYKDAATLLWSIGFTKGDKVLPFEKGKEYFIKLLKSLESDSSLTDNLHFILSVLDPKTTEEQEEESNEEISEESDENKGEN